jgi:hypothetical protein
VLDWPTDRVKRIAPRQADVFEVRLKPSEIVTAKPIQEPVSP